MRILIVATGIVGDSPGLSGGEARFISLAKHWAAQGHEIHVLGQRGAETLCRSLELSVRLHEISTARGEGRANLVLTALLSYFLPLPQSLEEFKDGIIYSISEQLYEVAPALRLKVRGKHHFKWATVIHWLPPFPPWKRKTSTALNSTLFFLSERIGVALADRFADVVLPVSANTAADLRRVSRCPSKIFPVACGVEFEAIQEYVKGVRGKKYDAVFMKRLQAVKGIFDLIDIWSEVVKHKPDARLAVIGSGIDGGRAREIVVARGLERNIKFLGVIYDMEEKFTQLAESRLFVLPSYEENWAIVIGEAMAVGIPVICYDLEGLKAVWGNNYAGVPVGDKQSFARSILDLLNDQQQCDQFAARARDFVRRYEWEEIAEKELEIITGVRST